MKKPTGTTRGRPLGFDREQALHTALQLFWQQGYEGTSIADLVSAMGIAPPSLYKTFGAKEQLYLEALHLYLEGPGDFLSRALNDASSGFDFVRRVLLDAAREFASGRHPQGCMIATGLLASASAHQPLAHAVATLRRATQEALARRIGQAQALGELAAESNPGQLAAFYAAILQGMSVQARDGADEATLTAIAEQALRLWPTAA